jgi:hypothetical protein
MHIARASSLVAHHPSLTLPIKGRGPEVHSRDALPQLVLRKKTHNRD